MGLHLGETSVMGLTIEDLIEGVWPYPTAVPPVAALNTGGCPQTTV